MLVQIVKEIPGSVLIYPKSVSLHVNVGFVDDQICLRTLHESCRKSRYLPNGFGFTPFGYLQQKLWPKHSVNVYELGLFKCTFLFEEPF